MHDFTIGSQWAISRELHKGSGQPIHYHIRVTKAGADTDGTWFNAEYTDAGDNGSTFEGRVESRSGSILSLRQWEEPTHYRAYHVANVVSGGDGWSGEWRDIDTHGGKFELGYVTG